MKKQFNLTLLFILIVLPLLSSCGRKNAPTVPPGETYNYPKSNPAK